MPDLKQDYENFQMYLREAQNTKDNDTAYDFIESAEELMAKRPDFPRGHFNRISQDIARNRFDSLLQKMRELGGNYHDYLARGTAGSCVIRMDSEGVMQYIPIDKEAKAIAEKYGFSEEDVDDVYWKHCSALEDTRSERRQSKSTFDRFCEWADNLLARF
jgi:hypothetical protein